MMCFSLPLMIYALAVPSALLMVNLDPGTLLGMRDFGGWPLPIYMLFFIYGFVVISHTGLQRRIVQQRWLSLALGAICIVALFVLWGAQGDAPIGTPRYAQIFTVFGISAWCWVLAIFGFGIKHLTRSTPFLQRANEAVLPFYVLHQSVLIYVGYFCRAVGHSRRIEVADYRAAARFAIIVGLIAIIRRVNVLRFLFMKPLKEPSAARIAQQPA